MQMKEYIILGLFLSHTGKIIKIWLHTNQPSVFQLWHVGFLFGTSVYEAYHIKLKMGCCLTIHMGREEEN